jgi:aryl-alcohol dehydrogenase-like predicted oxidoreductase
VSLLAGRATAEGTRQFAARFPRTSGFFRTAQHLTVSSIGLGTFPGNADDETDAGYEAALEEALEHGCNVIDTSAAYRDQRSERAVGRTLGRLIAAGRLRRDAVVVASKAGFLPFDSAYDGSVEHYIEETFLRPGIVKPADIAAGRHCLSPDFLLHQIRASRENLGCETLDIYCLHNPETQLREIDRAEFHARMRAAFATLERALVEGWIGWYGVSTWSGLRSLPDAPDHLQLRDLVRYAEEAGGPDHHFRVLLVPFNLAMPEAFALSNQRLSDSPPGVPLLRAAADLGLTVFAGSSLHQARLARGLPPELHSLILDGDGTDAQRALQFARSAPGVTTALVGMSRPANVRENLALASVPPLSADRFDALFDP